MGALNRSHAVWEMRAWTWDLYWLYVCITSVLLLPETLHCRKVWLVVELCTGPQEKMGQLLDKKKGFGRAEQLRILSLNSGYLCLLLCRHLVNIC